MFFLNLGYKWSFQSLEGLEAAILLPSSNSIEKFADKRPDVRNLLFDPQLYLSTLNCADAGTVCSRLVCYPWFGAEDVPTYDGEETRRDWERSVRESISENWRGKAPRVRDAERLATTAIQFQQGLTCSHIILPSPLLTEREGEGAVQAQWLDAGLSAAESCEVDEPILATVAIADIALNDAAFEAYGILDTVVDQITSREGIDGVYIVVVQSGKPHPLRSPLSVHKAYAWLTRAFADAGYEHIITNFADVFGIACLGLGATGLATGQSHALRRMSLVGFDDDSFGRALPYLYSHRMVAELASETDLNLMRDAKLLRRVQDITPASERLFAVLRGGGSASSVLAWVESVNNIKAANTHFLTRVLQSDKELSQLPVSSRLSAIEDWLEDATATGLFVQERLGRPLSDLKGAVAPSSAWLGLLEA